jgi:transmembrane sensor
MSIEQEAADWFARMRGPEAEGSRDAFEVWRTDAARASAYEEAVRAWDRTMFLANTGTGRRRSLEAVGTRRWRFAGWAWAAAAFLAVGVGSMLAVHLAGDPSTRASYVRTETASLEQAPRTLRLPDGSTVILDRGARLHILFGHNERRLRLLAGRARFSVAQEKARAFVVEAGGGDVVAHGTLFDVEVQSGCAEVALLEGLVEVRSSLAGRRSVELSAGESVAFTGGRLGNPRAGAPRDDQWTQDMIAFRAEDIRSAAAAFNRTSRVKVTVAADIPPGLEISGAFRRSDPEGFARQAAETFNLKVEARKSGGFALVRAL